MNAEILHDALTLLPEDLIAETDALRQAKRPKIIPWKRILPLAACLCLILLTAPTMLALMAPKGAKEMAMDCAPAEAAPAPQLGKAQAEDELRITPAEESPVEAPTQGVQEKAAAAAGESPADRSLDNGRQQGSVPKVGAAYGLTAHYFPTQLWDAGVSRKITVISSRSALDDYLAQCNALYFDEALATACEAYDEDYFADNQLILLLTAKDLPTASYSGNVLLPIQSGNWSVSRDGETGWVIEVGDMVHDLNTVQQHIVLELPDQLIGAGDSVTLVQTPKED